MFKKAGAHWKPVSQAPNSPLAGAYPALRPALPWSYFRCPGSQSADGLAVLSACTPDEGCWYFYPLYAERMYDSLFDVRHYSEFGSMVGRLL